MAVAAPGLQIVPQRDFSAGAYPQNERIPDNGVEDIINGLLDEDGSIYRRGGSAYKGTVAASAANKWGFLWDGVLAPGPRTLVGRDDVHWFTLDAADTTWLDLSVSGLAAPARHRPAVVNGMLVFNPVGSATGVKVSLWGGARGNLGFPGPISMTVTNGSKTVTGTSFTTYAEPGTLLIRGTAPPNRHGVVDSVQSATQLTLSRAWQGPTETTNFFLAPFTTPTETAFGSTMLTTSGPGTFVASMYGRLIIARGSRIAFTASDDPFVFANPTDYHDLPVGAQVVGLEPLRDQLLVFTTKGVFALTGLAFDLTDPQGNPQQRLERTNPEVTLWSDLGIAAWQGAVIAPAADDIYLIDSAASMRAIGGGIRRLYRSYVRQGNLVAGQAAVFANHYVLPITVLSPWTWVDTLVCNLQTGAWSRWDGHGGAVSNVVRRPRTGASSRLFATAVSSDYRILDLGNAWTPTAAVKNDADGSTHQWQVTTRSFSFGDRVRRQWRRLWARYELDDAGSDNPTVSLETAEDRVGTSFTSESETGSEGDDGHTWTFSKRARAIRFRLKSNGPSASLRLRELEVFVRPSGRR